MSEIVEAVVSQSQNGWVFSALHGQPHHGRFPFAVEGLRSGDRVVVDVAPEGTSWSVSRVLSANGAPLRSPAVLKDAPLPAQNNPVPFRPGAVLLRRFRFLAESQDNRNSKVRPCVVLECSGTEMRVRPIHGSNSAVRREGMGRRLRDWKAAGLNKPSVVAGFDIWLPATGAPPIGFLSADDSARLLPELSHLEDA